MEWMLKLIIIYAPLYFHVLGTVVSAINSLFNIHVCHCRERKPLYSKGPLRPQRPRVQWSASSTSTQTLTSVRGLCRLRPHHTEQYDLNIDPTSTPERSSLNSTTRRSDSNLPLFRIICYSARAHNCQLKKIITLSTRLNQWKPLRPIKSERLLVCRLKCINLHLYSFFLSTSSPVDNVAHSRPVGDNPCFTA